MMPLLLTPYPVVYLLAYFNEAKYNCTKRTLEFLFFLYFATYFEKCHNKYALQPKLWYMFGTLCEIWSIVVPGNKRLGYNSSKDLTHLFFQSFPFVSCLWISCFVKTCHFKSTSSILFVYRSPQKVEISIFFTFNQLV